MAAASLLLMAGTATAQDAAWKSYTYAEVQGGLQLTSTNEPMDKLFTPTASLSLGHYFSPVVGARLHVNAWQSKSGYASIVYYKWKYVTPDLDLMVNLSNLFCSSKEHALNLILLGGVGLNYAWDNDELADLRLPATATPLAWEDNRLSHNIRAGLRLETNMQKPLGLSLEVNANSLDDRFNSKTNDRDDWMFTAQLGLNYRFGHKATKKTPIVREIEETIEEEVPVTKIVKERRSVQKTENVTLHKEIFYAIRVSENESPSAIMQQVAQFIRDNKNVKVTAVGYADKGTGNARLNQMYAQRRAETFLNDMVEKYGCERSLFTIDSKGDTVQPFEENDKNRCVIIDAQGVREYTDYEEVDVEKTVMETRTRVVKRQIVEE